MTGKEQIWRWILGRYLEAGETHWQQVMVAQVLNLSPSTVHAALQVPRRSGAIRVGGRGFELVDWRKLLTIWAVYRNLDADTLALWSLDLPASEVEGRMLPEARFSGPSAFKFAYGFVPADYDEVVVYLDRLLLEELKARFQGALRRRGATELRVLAPDPHLPASVPMAQVYVDLWQMHPWWTAEFLRELEERLDATRVLS